MWLSRGAALRGPLQTGSPSHVASSPDQPILRTILNTVSIEHHSVVDVGGCLVAGIVDAWLALSITQVQIMQTKSAGLATGIVAANINIKSHKLLSCLQHTSTNHWHPPRQRPDRWKQRLPSRPYAMMNSGSQYLSGSCSTPAAARKVELAPSDRCVAGL